jgi:hypothetical protein
VVRATSQLKLESAGRMAPVEVRLADLQGQREPWSIRSLSRARRKAAREEAAEEHDKARGVHQTVYLRALIGALRWSRCNERPHVHEYRRAIPLLFGVRPHESRRL